MSREPKPKQRTKSGTWLEELIEKWLVSNLATHDPKTVKTWKLYAASHWLPFFDALHNINDVMGVDYRDARLSLHLRSARITHLLEATGNVPATQFMAGHKQTTTTARDVKLSLRAADAIWIAKPAR